MKIEKPEAKPSISELKKAARQLAGTKPERQAFIELLRKEPIVDAKELTEVAAGGVADYYEARRNFNNLTLEQLAKGLRLALALSRSEKMLEAFYQHKFWDGKRPNQAKVILHCLQFALPPRNDLQRKLLSKHAAAISWLVLQGHGPDGLRNGVAKEGGFSACATKLAAWRRSHKKKRADDKARTAGAKTDAKTRKNEIENIDAAATSLASGTTKFPVKFVPGLRQKIKDRQPPADQKYFWARVRHRGNRITIVELSPIDADS